MHLSRSKISASAIAVIALFVCMELFSKNPNGAVGVAIVCAGGLCGSLFAFLTSPKAHKAKKSEAAMAEFRDEASPRFSVKSTRKPSADETTVVGTLEL